MATVGEWTDSTAVRGSQQAQRGMVVPRIFSTEGVSPYDQVEWDERTAAIKDARGRELVEELARLHAPIPRTGPPWE